MALMAYRRNRLCPCGCGHLAVETLVDTDASQGTAYLIHEHRCLATAALEIRKRDMRLAKVPRDKWPAGYKPGRMQPEDGLVLHAQPDRTDRR